MKHPNALLFLGLSAASLGGVACSSDAKTIPTPVPITIDSNRTCEPADGFPWTNDVPESLGANFPAYAVKLNVSQEQIREGTFGSITCEPRVPGDTIPAIGERISVKDKGVDCLIVGKAALQAPQVEFVAICANPALAG
jgi:hypothetical protein